MANRIPLLELGLILAERRAGSQRNQWSQREGSNLRPADYEPTGLAFQLTDNKIIMWRAKSIVLGLCSPVALFQIGDQLPADMENWLSNHHCSIRISLISKRAPAAGSSPGPIAQNPWMGRHARQNKADAHRDEPTAPTCPTFSEARFSPGFHLRQAPSTIPNSAD